jgi:hypothetical protein
VKIALSKNFAVSRGIDIANNPVLDAIDYTIIAEDHGAGIKRLVMCYEPSNKYTSSCKNNSNIIATCNVNNKTCKGSWPVNLGASGYKVFAVMQDGADQVVTAQTPLQVYGGHSVKITSPKTSTIAPKEITITAIATSPNGLDVKLKSISFYNQGVPLPPVVYSGINCDLTSNAKVDISKATSTTLSTRLNIKTGNKYILTAKAQDCQGRVSTSAEVTVTVPWVKPTTAPKITFFDPVSPITATTFNIEATTVATATTYHLFEKMLSPTPANSYTKVADSVSGAWTLSKSFEHNGRYSYCAKAGNKAGIGPIGITNSTTTQCKTIEIAIPVSQLPAPTFNHIALQQASHYTLAWSSSTWVDHYEIWGGKGSHATANLGLLDSPKKPTYLQKYPTLGNYSYLVKACTKEGLCFAGQKITINHQAPYIQSATFDKSCGTHCLSLQGIGLTPQSRVSIQLRNSTETYQFYNQGRYQPLSAPNAHTLNINTEHFLKQFYTRLNMVDDSALTRRISDGLATGGLLVKVFNPKIINAPTATIVLDNSGDSDRIDLIKHAPSISDKGNIYVGVGNNIHSLNSGTGVSNKNWPYVAGGDVVAAPTLAKDSDGNDLIYVGAKDHYVYALKEDKTERWKTKTRGEIIAQAALDNNQLYVGSMDKALYAINTNTGDIQWQYPLPAGISQKPMVYASGLIYVTTDDEQIHTINRKNIGLGALKWQDIDSSLMSDHLANNLDWQPTQGQITERHIIARLFYAVLQRAPSKAELTFFLYAAFMGNTGDLDTLASAALNEIANAFLLSHKGVANFPPADANSLFLDKVYAVLFPQGAPDLIAGHNKEHWLAELDDGSTRSYVLLQLVSAVEYGTYADTAVSALLHYYYEECTDDETRRGDCNYSADSDGDGYTDDFETLHGFDLTDPFDTKVAIPTLTSSTANLGEFTLTIGSDESTTHFRLLEANDMGEFNVISTHV